MREVGIHEAKTQLSKLLREAEAGTEVVILRGRRPVAWFVSVRAPEHPHAGTAWVLGADRDVLVVPDDFDAPLPEEALDDFES
jgi:antitoxin (DNA-binding transcriptional repressor) of toxin-antitoxin stability system